MKPLNFKRGFNNIILYVKDPKNRLTLGVCLLILAGIIMFGFKTFLFIGSIGIAVYFLKDQFNDLKTNKKEEESDFDKKQNELWEKIN